MAVDDVVVVLVVVRGQWCQRRSSLPSSPVAWGGTLRCVAAVGCGIMGPVQEFMDQLSMNQWLLVAKMESVGVQLSKCKLGTRSATSWRYPYCGAAERLPAASAATAT